MGSLRRLAVLDDYQRVAASYADWDALRARGVDVVFFHEHLGDDAARALQGFDAVAAMRERTAFDRVALERLPALRLLVTTGMANASIDLVAARERGIVVAGTPGSAAGAPELTWALLLAALRNLPVEDGNARSGAWQQTVGREAEEMTLGIVGLGRIGSRIARYAHAFGMSVAAWSPHLTEERAAAAGAERASTLLELAERADILSLHLRLSDSTRLVVGERELRALGPDGLLVNTARAGLVDTDALVRGLTEGWLGGAALDVFDTEPLPHDHPLASAPRTVLTPHLGYVTSASYEVFYPAIVENVQAFLDGAPIRVLG
ncbi:2-hydroxyacid dehydrogenase [Microbacterium barkeri]|uniref:2-hydroxyacid dehydrogenase n=1 Tax=Microbacterium barkeri TaxID=33917 RepID=A0A9W6H2S7_9MICO|nr:D-2-hydroxyacid dehydrogenase family protein [Microbacterium barkeri]MDR6875619.1 phosphoglycerate dehydrogenase-like enzyme [Microbacterium barkeri]GLJ61532.1 2-hydroxyacid dehydrogenase [Microbacterium barkeri]